MKMKKIISILTAAMLISVMQLSAQLDRTVAPEPGPAPKVELGKHEKFTLKNGLRVILVENHERPIVSVSLNFIRDPFVEGDKAGISGIFGEMWGKGTKKRTAQQISEEAEFLGTSLGTSSGGLGFSTLTKYLPNMMDLMTDVLYNPTFPQEEMDKVIEQTLGGLQMSMSQPSYVMGNITTATVYPKDHPYGDIQSEETTKNITVADCKAFHKKYIVPSEAILVLQGDITLDEAKELADKYFKKWKGKAVEKKEYAPIARPEGIQIIFSPKDGAKQSTISMMTPIDYQPGAEDALAVGIANQIYGGGDFAAKLMRNLRETKGYTYGAYSSISSDKLSGTFESSADVNANATDSSFIEMTKEMNAMLAGDFTQEDLEKFKKTYAGSFSRSLESDATIARFAIMTERYGFPEDYYSTYLQRLDAVTLEDVKAAVAKYFDPANQYYFVVGDPSVLEGLEKLDSDGKVVKLDYLGRPIKEVDANVTAESVMNKFLDFYGGKENILAIKDFKVVQQIVYPGYGVIETTITSIPKSKMFKMTQNMGDMNLATIVRKGASVVVNQQGQVQEITNPEEVEAISSEFAMLHSEAFVEDFSTYSIEGIETIGKRDYYKVKNELEGGVTLVDFIDMETGERIKTSMSAQGQTMDTIYEGILESNGIKYPKKVTQMAGGQSMTTETVDFQINTGILPYQL